MAKKRTTRQPPKHPSRATWDAKIRQLIEAQSRRELADLVWTLIQRFPELREEFRERIALSEGDVEQLVAEARRELQQVASETGWRNRWNDEGHTPDYSRLKNRLERLVEKGHFDAVAELGREVIRRGLQQVAESHDEGETAMAVTDCLPIVFQAIKRSKLTGPAKILFAIDAHLADDYGVIDAVSDVVLHAKWSSEDWAAVAECLAARLQQESVGSPSDFSASYRRNRVSDWLVQALTNAGRQDEVLAVYEREAPVTASYERLVRYLIEMQRFEEAERWAREGIERSRDGLPGIAGALARSLCEVARRRREWDVVAAHAAWPFFLNPSAASFDELMKAALKAKCQEQVRTAALHFLETGERPYRQVTTRQGQTRITIGKDWPLPLPDYLVPLLRLDASSRQPSPHYDVLLQMALAAKCPVDVLHWYDKLCAGNKRYSPGWARSPGHGYSDQVAAAVAATHPERALAIYHAALQSQLTHADPRAYEAAAGYLRKLRPILKSLQREGEWEQMLADIRQQYRNRPRFMEILKRLDKRPIVHSEKARRVR